MQGRAVYIAFICLMVAITVTGRLFPATKQQPKEETPTTTTTTTTTVPAVSSDVPTSTSSAEKVSACESVFIPGTPAYHEIMGKFAVDNLTASLLGSKKEGTTPSISSAASESESLVVIAILAKDKAHTLPHYLRSLERFTWPRNRTILYIRSNNNNDGTVDVLRAWVARQRMGTGPRAFAYIYEDYRDTPEQVQRFGQHEWNGERFKVLGAIRQKSIDFTRCMAAIHERRTHYFVADCDNIVSPRLLTALIATGKPVVGPLMRGTSDTPFYFNFHASIDKNGYYATDPREQDWVNYRVRGIFEVPVIHTTYLVRHEVLNHQNQAHAVTYNDGSGRYEYVIFSDALRKAGITQWLDNTAYWGCVTMLETAAALRADPVYRQCVHKLGLDRPVITRIDGYDCMCVESEDTSSGDHRLLLPG